MDFMGLRLEIFPEVYEPAEDSFLLAKHVKELRGRVLDVGCGCGIQSLICARAHPRNDVIGVDLNPNAVANSKLNAKLNGIENAHFLESNLFSKVGGIFDGIAFNPPYLPTSELDRVKGKLNLAFDGGRNGRKTTDKFLRGFSKFLKRNGTLLMVESSLAGIEKTIGKLEKAGFEAEIIDEEGFFFEKIVVIRAKRRKV